MHDGSRWRACLAGGRAPARNEVREQHRRREQLVGRDAERDEGSERRAAHRAARVDEDELLGDERSAAAARLGGPPERRRVLDGPDERHEAGAGLALRHVAVAHLQENEGERQCHKEGW